MSFGTIVAFSGYHVKFNRDANKNEITSVTFNEAVLRKIQPTVIKRMSRWREDVRFDDNSSRNNSSTSDYTIVDG